ncbi:formate dehydrogenase [Corynebacterium riegelii]|uniref:Formate dehydrogenase n=2 Tax=Corynebacterium riegelii TaxID=156976 RepID=A0A0K1RF90_9CORY|nr:formate dehydrogenase [Corynebacterium riegelii]
MANADCIVIQGSNMAEAHPVGFQWVIEAKNRGARIIHVDPRFTRTSAIAHKHIPIRGGSDVVLLGAVIKYVLDNELYFEDFVKAFTNASVIINEDFQDTEDLEGIFSGYDSQTGKYDNSTWQPKPAWDAQVSWDVEKDETLQDPNCVFQILKRHYSRYTPEMVEKSCGISQEDFYYLANSIAENSGRERTTCFAYALGWTQHTMGAQFIRTCAILQLLMGNVGRPGSGIMALRGHASIQGSTDVPTLFHLLPGYLPMPQAEVQTWDQYLDAVAMADQKGFWQKRDDYSVSLMKAYWGDAATEDNNWGMDLMPRLTGAHSTYHTLQLMMQGQVDGYFVFGQNPAVAQSNGYMQRMALSKLKWLVVRDFQEIETATFWKDSPEVASGALVTEEIDTEVFLLPAANHVEKAGTFTQTQRLLQWRFQAKQPPGDADSDLQFFYELGLRLKERVKDSTDPRDLPLQSITWDYDLDEHGEIDAESVLREINGYFLEGPRKGQLVDSFADLKADGTTSSGCWIYSGVFAGGVNRSANKRPGSEQDEMALDWGWAWPLNRRVLYNRASADADGKPWSERKKLVWWNEDAERWESPDVVDFPVNKAPDYKPDRDTVGPDALAGDDPFIMQPDGKGWLFAPRGMVDGPMPTHYEPQESPFPNFLYKQQQSPSRIVMRGPNNLSAPNFGEEGTEVYPYILNTYRLTEMYTSGAMTRTLPFLAELQPELFCEVSPQLAEKVGLENGGWATLISPRGAIESRVLVTDRIQSLTIGEQQYEQIGMPFHYGKGKYAEVSGDGPNDLLGIMLDPNVNIQASKVSAVDIRPGRRPRGAERDALVREYQKRAGLTENTGSKLGSHDATASPGLDDEDTAEVDNTKRNMAEREG